MKQKTVYKISVFLAVTGLTLMYASSLYIDVEEAEIGEIEESWAGKSVKVQGNATSFTKSGGHAFVEVEDSTGKILVVEFDSNSELEEDDQLQVTGHVELYEGKLEIIAEEIETI